MGQPRDVSGVIPDKLYFKIGEVSGIVGVDSHVLRYWESEFTGIRPLRTSSRQRLYRRGDIEKLIRIRELLYDQGFTIAGARQALKDEKKSGVMVGERSPERLVKSLKRELVDLKKFLES